MRIFLTTIISLTTIVALNANAANLPNGWKLKEHSIKKSEGTNCAIDLKYLTLESSSSEAADVKKMRSLINLKLKKFSQISSAIAGYKNATKNIADNCGEDYADHEGSPFDSEITVTAKLVDERYISVELSNYINEGGAHPNVTIQGLTIDLTTALEVKLNQILDVSKLSAIGKIISEEVAKQCEKDDEDCKSVAADYKNITKESLNKLAFSVSTESIHFADNDLPHAIQALGVFSIQWAKLAPVLMSNSPFGKDK